MISFAKKHFDLQKTADFFLYLAIALLAISDSGVQLLILNALGSGSRTLRLIAMWLLLAKVLMTRYTKKEFFILAPIALLALYNYHAAGNTYGVYTILVISAMKDTDYPLLFKVLFFSTLGTLFFVGILSFLGIGSPVKLVEDFGRGLVETRYCPGLYHPNIWHQAISRCIIFGCIGYYKKLNVFHILVLSALNYFVYTLSVSRTGFLATSLFLIMLLFCKYFKKIMHSHLIKLSLVAAIIEIYSLYIRYIRSMYKAYDPIVAFFDRKITNGRIAQALEFLKTHTTALFASRFPDDGTVFDCGFFRFFYEFGYLWAFVFFIAFFILLLYSMKKNWDPVIPVCIHFVLYSLYEFSPVTRPTFHIVIFFFPLLIFQCNRKKFSDWLLSCQRKGNPPVLPSS